MHEKKQCAEGVLFTVDAARARRLSASCFSRAFEIRFGALEDAVAAAASPTVALETSA